jgi:hypothetical protein
VDLNPPDANLVDLTAPFPLAALPDDALDQLSRGVSREQRVRQRLGACRDNTRLELGTRDRLDDAEWCAEWPNSAVLYAEVLRRLDAERVSS